MQLLVKKEGFFNPSKPVSILMYQEELGHEQAYFQQTSDRPEDGGGNKSWKKMGVITGS